jgi:hypothetical protein
MDYGVPMANYTRRLFFLFPSLFIGLAGQWPASKQTFPGEFAASHIVADYYLWTASIIYGRDEYEGWEGGSYRDIFMPAGACELDNLLTYRRYVRGFVLLFVIKVIEWVGVGMI